MARTDHQYTEKQLFLSPTKNTAVDGERTTTNYSTDASFKTSYYYDYAGVQELYEFDVSAIPTDAEVISARLVTYRNDDENDTVAGLSCEILEVTSDWDESTVTWDTKPTRNSLRLGLINEPTGEGTYVTSEGNTDLAGLVQDWVSGARPNKGLTTVRTGTTTVGSGGSWYTWVSSDNGSFPPRLEVKYKESPSFRSGNVLDLSSLGRYESGEIEWKTDAPTGGNQFQDSGTYGDYYIQLDSTSKPPYTLRLEIAPDNHADGDVSEQKFLINGIDLGTKTSPTASLRGVYNWGVLSIDVSNEVIEGSNHVKHKHISGGDRGYVKNLVIEDSEGSIFHNQHGSQLYGTVTATSNDGSGNAVDLVEGFISLEVRVSRDSGSSWSIWEAVDSGDPIPHLVKDEDISSTLLEYRVVKGGTAGEHEEVKLVSIDVNGYKTIMKVWDGSQWREIPAKIWDGSQWITAVPKTYTGEEWL